MRERGGGGGGWGGGMRTPPSCTPEKKGEHFLEGKPEVDRGEEYASIVGYIQERRETYEIYLFVKTRKNREESGGKPCV